jgi:hypothetical protein
MGIHKPLTRIAMSFSGGGFRAAAFSLGCLSYLNKSELLSKVAFMASASGGTLASLPYAHALYSSESFSFDEFYEELKSFLAGDKALTDAFTILNKNSEWEDTPEKGRNLINAFAKVYHRDLFKGDTWNRLFDSDKITQKHLKQICLNSTEFKNGLPFRFQNVDNKNVRGVIGNYTSFLKNKGKAKVLERIRLGDITAASSCFPLGFEPIMFPDDFTYKSGEETLSKDDLFEILNTPKINKQIVSIMPDATKHGIGLDTEVTEELEKENPGKNTNSDEKLHTSFGLMDGGITDNQAIQSLMLADSRTNGNFDTFIVCDVTSPFMSGYSLPTVRLNVFNRLSLNGWGIIYLLLITGLSVWAYVCQKNVPLLATFIALLFVVPLILGVYLFSQLSSKEAKENTWTKTIKKHFKYFFSIPVGSLWQMIKARTKSAGIMVGDVFLKQIRRMWYNQLFENKKWDNHRIAVMVYELSEKHYELTRARIGRNSGLNSIVTGLELIPTNEMKKIAQTASNVDTTLWFDDNHVRNKALESLIATGQFTMCYNLLIYISNMEVHQPDLLKQIDGLPELKSQLIKDWESFKKDPWQMVETKKK